MRSTGMPRRFIDGGDDVRQFILGVGDGSVGALLRCGETGAGEGEDFLGLVEPVGVFGLWVRYWLVDRIVGVDKSSHFGRRKWGIEGLRRQGV